MKYQVKNDISVFEFHDAELELLRYDKSTKELVVLAKHLNIHDNTEQNQSEHHLEIKDAEIHFINFRNLTIDAGGIYKEDENGDLKPIEEPTYMSSDEALSFLLEKLSCNCFFSVFELTKTEDGSYYMPVSTMTCGFNARFNFDDIIISWNEYEGWAWYEEWRLSKLNSTEDRQ